MNQKEFDDMIDRIYPNYKLCRERAKKYFESEKDLEPLDNNLEREYAMSNHIS